MRRLALPLALLFAFAPAIAAEPPAQPAAAETASAADVDRLLQAIDMQSMMAGMMQQIGGAQEKMLADAFGKDLSAEARKTMQQAMADSNAVVQKHLSWSAMEPIVRKVYMQVFSKREVQAMTAFYTTPEGAAILKKSPQAMALTMQEFQPVMVAAMQEVKETIDRRAAQAR